MPDELQFLEPSKERESDAVLRRELLHTLLLLTTTREGREIMRQRKVYPIIREMHLAESNEECDAVAHDLVQMLIRDESQHVEPETRIVHEAIVEEKQVQVEQDDPEFDAKEWEEFSGII